MTLSLLYQGRFYLLFLYLFGIGNFELSASDPGTHSVLNKAEPTTLISTVMAPPTFSGCDVLSLNVQMVYTSGSCGATVTWNEPVASPDAVLVTSNYQPGETLLPGTTAIIYRAENVTGEIGICTFNVTVEDNENPVFTTFPTDVSLTADPNTCTAPYSWAEPEVTDNCPAGEGYAPVLQDFESALNQCYIFSRTSISTSGEINGTRNLLANSLSSSAAFTSSLRTPVFYFNGTGDISFSHSINNLSRTAFIHIDILDSSGAIVISNFFVEEYTSTAVQQEIIPMTLTGDYQLLIRYSSNIFFNNSQRSYLDDLLIPGTIVTNINDPACNLADYVVIRSDGTGNLSGDQFEVGTTTIEYTVLDANDNLSVRSFNITVMNDVNPPAGIAEYFYCEGTPPPALTVTVNTANGETANWYDPNGVLVAANTTTYTPPATTDFYRNFLVYAENANGCSSEDYLSIDLYQIPLPPPPGAASPIEYCINEPAVALVATGEPGNSLEWYNQPSGGASQGPSLVPNTSVAGTTFYYVQQTDISTGCISSRTVVEVIVHALPASPVLFANSVDYCVGDSAQQLNAHVQTGSNLTWYDAPSGGNVVPGTTVPSTAIAGTSSYWVTQTQTAANCESPRSRLEIIVHDPPMFSLQPADQTVCDGTSVVFSVTAVNTVALQWQYFDGFSWIDLNNAVPYSGVTTNSLSVINPAFALNGTAYRVVGSSAAGSCGNAISNPAILSVDPLPTVTANTTATAVCQGQSVTLTGTGAASYSWNNGVIDGLAFTPASTTTYTVSGTDGNGCINTDTITITVNPLPTVSANATDTEICQGQPVTLSGSGATSYTWDHGITDGLAFTPATTTIYTVTGTDGNGCSNSDTITITVNPLPTVTANTTDTAICQGQPVTLSGSGATAYSWDNGVTDGVPFTPVSTSTYTVTGTDGNGCINIDSITITVNPAPGITITAAAACTSDLLTYSLSLSTAGDSVSTDVPSAIITDTGGGAWMISGIPAGTGIQLIATDTGSGCQTILNVTAPDCSCPIVDAPVSGGDQSYCQGSAIPGLSVNVNAGETADWYDAAIGGALLQSSSVVIAPGTAGTYYAEARDITTGCVSSTRTAVQIIENPLPAVIASTTAVEVCQGQPVTLTGSGAVSYSWDNGVTDGVAFIPAATTTYMVTGTDGNGCINSDTITITVNALPNVTANTTAMQVCQGQAVTLSGSGATFYSWDNGVTDGAPITPATTTTYTVTGTDGNGCTNTDTITITVNPLPGIIITAAAACAPDLLTYSLSLSTTGDSVSSDVPSANIANTGGGIWTISGVPSGTNIALTTTNTVTGCQSTLSVTAPDCSCPVVDAPISAGDQSYCQGSTIPTISVTVNAGETADWYDASSGGSLLQSGSLTLAPGTAGTYYAEARDVTTACLSSARTAIQIIENVLPTVTANTTATEVCAGQPVTLSGSGVTTYSWDKGVTNGVAFIPASTTTYTVTGTDGNGCTDTDTLTITVNPLPTVTANTTSMLVCQGQAVTLTGSGAMSYSWDNGVTDGAAFSPASTSTYTVTGTDVNGCVNTDTITITVNPLPTVTANTTATEICTGQPVTLSGSGATSYSWDNGVTDGVAFTPVGTTTYTVAGTDANGCTSTDTITIAVNPLPTITANTTSLQVCQGEPVTLTGSGATAYSWDNGITNGVAFTPASTTTYTVTGTDGNGCANTDTVTITVNPLPGITVTAAAACAPDLLTYSLSLSTAGDSVSSDVPSAIITDTGGGIWTISGIPSGTGIQVTATHIGTGCQTTLNVTAPDCSCPVVDAPVSGGDQFYCQGSAIPGISVTVNAGETADWYDAPSGGTLLQSGNIALAPGVAGTYHAEARDIITGCTSSTRSAVQIIEIPLPAVTANTTAAEVCQGQPVTLTASGAVSYSWDNGVTNGVAFIPSSTTIYTVTGTDGNGCSSSDTITITVNPLPLVIGNTSAMEICQGQAVILTGSGAVSYNWDNGVTDGAAFTPATTTTYTVTGTDGNGCINTDSITITVHPLPAVTANTTAIEVCMGEAVTLSGSGASTYSWDNGVIDGVAFTPPTTSTYIVTGTDGNGCINTDTITITVYPLPVVNASCTAIEICQGETVTLTGSGAASYSWDNGVTDGVAFTPANTTTYTVTGTDGNGCTDTDTITITVNPLPLVNANATDTEVCQGQQVTLSGSGALTYNWDNGITDGVAFTPAGTATYTVTGTDGNGCANTDTITITVNPLPSITANATAIQVCQGESVTLTGSGATAYSWDNGVTDGVPFTPATTTTYTVTGTDGNGCTNTDSITITVNPLPAITVAAAAACAPDLLTYSMSLSTAGDAVISDVPSAIISDTGGGIWTISGIPSGTGIQVTATHLSTGCQTILNVSAPDCSCPVVDAPVSDGDRYYCQGSTIPGISVTVNAGETADWYDAPAGGTLLDSNDVTCEPTTAGTYYAEARDIITGCVSSTRTAVQIIENPLPPVIANASRTLIQAGEAVILSGAGASSYMWDLGVTDGDTVMPLVTTTFTVIGTDGNNCQATDSVTVVVMPTSDLSLQKAVDNTTPNVGESVTFTLTVGNDGPSDTNAGTIVEDVLPSGYAYISDSGNATSGTYDPSYGIWLLPALPTGTAVSLNITVRVNPPAQLVGEYINLAQITQATHFDPDSSPGNGTGNQLEDDEARAEITLVPADLSLSKILVGISGAVPNIGEVVTFELSVTNIGPGIATNVSIRDIVPSGYTLISVGNGGVVNGNSISWNFPELTVGTQVVRYNVTVNAPSNTAGEYTNLAEIMTSDQFDPDSTPANDDGDQSEDDEAAHRISTPSVDLEVLKTVDKPQTFEGDVLVFTISVTNLGSAAASAVGIEDILPAGYILESTNPSLGTYTSDTSTWDIPRLEAGATATLEMSVTVTAQAQYTNTATLIYLDQVDINVGNDQSAVTPEVSQSACLTVYNEFSPNGDGANDVFYIECIEQYPNNYVQVFNRWGNKVFEAHSYKNDWDGVSYGSGTVGGSRKLPVGTYYYLLESGEADRKGQSGWLYITR